MTADAIEPAPILPQVVLEGSRIRRAHWLPRDALVGAVLALATAGLGYCSSSGMFKSVPLAIWVVVNGVFEFGIFLAFPLAMLRRRSEGVPRAQRPARSLFKEFLLAIPWTIGVLVFVLCAAMYARFILTSFHRSIETPQEFWGRFPPGTFVAFAVLAVTVAPVVEEVFFRGYLYNSLRTVLPTWLAMIAQAILFGLGHFYEPLGIVVATVIGLLQAVIYERRKTLIAPVFVHCLWNCLVVTIAVGIVIASAKAPVIGVMFVPDANGKVVVKDVLPKSSAEEAGIQAGDVILEYNGQTMNDSEQLIRLVRKGKVGEEVTLEILRGGERMEMRVKLRARSGLQ